MTLRSYGIERSSDKMTPSDICEAYPDIQDHMKIYEFMLVCIGPLFLISMGRGYYSSLRNYVKAIKLFCRMNRINICWDIISHSLPKVKIHDWKTLHGFRNFFKTQAERAMKSLNVEILIGHDIGLRTLTISLQKKRSPVVSKAPFPKK